MAEEQDVAAEFLDSNTHMAMMYGSRIMEQVARAREQQARDQEQEIREQTRLMEREQTRVERAQENASRDVRDAARMKYTRVMHESFWEKTSPEEIGDTINTALQWRDKDPKAQVACEKIGIEVKARYGVALADIEQFLNDIQKERSEAENNREEAEYYRGQETSFEEKARSADTPAEESMYSAQAEEYSSRSNHAWDSAEQREYREAFYEGQFDTETAESAKYADRARGHRLDGTVTAQQGINSRKRRLRSITGAKERPSLER